MLDKLTVLISDHNDGCTFLSTSFAGRCKHSNAVVGVFIQTRQSSSSSWSMHELSFFRHTSQRPVGNSVTQNNAILISRWNLVPLNDNASRACVKFGNIIRWDIWLCNKRQRTNTVSTKCRKRKNVPGPLLSKMVFKGFKKGAQTSKFDVNNELNQVKP